MISYSIAQIYHIGTSLAVTLCMVPIIINSTSARHGWATTTREMVFCSIAKQIIIRGVCRGKRHLVVQFKLHGLCFVAPREYISVSRAQAHSLQPQAEMVIGACE